MAEKSVAAVLEMAAEGATVPFMARYRKEKTGNLDEVQIRETLAAYEKYNEIIKRKEFLIKEIEGQGNLTAAIRLGIEKSMDMAELDEIYRPFKRKKKTKATLAREAGLEPLADWIWKLGHGEIREDMTLEVKGKEFINVAKEIITYEVALKGAQDIIIERISNDPGLRETVRKNFFAEGKIVSKKGKDYSADSKFEMYQEFEETIKSIQTTKASHRYLAIRRGWQEGQLTVSIQGDEAKLTKLFQGFACTVQNQSTDFLNNCGKLALNTHVIPSLSNEVHTFLKEKADKDGVHVFAENVRRVLLASPFGAKCVLGVDPGLRTGCKLALVDKNGAYISSTVMKTLGDDAQANAKKLFSEVLKQIKIEAIAVGNGTGGRETEVFLRNILKELDQQVPVVMVNESGASIYSASDVAREEFPDLDLTVRGAVSIARRLQDPLAELVKIDPKSIGVGQYQHDVSQTLLKQQLTNVVEDCVNQIGVDLNTASEPLLSYVSGVGPGLAKNIVEYRKSHGLFEDRAQLQSVPRFSSKTFEQAAGFLRIRKGKVPLDATGVHPERYAAVKDMASELGMSVTQLMGEGVGKLRGLKEKWVPLVGQFTFDDVVTELEKPGRDPRDPFKIFTFREDIHEVKDLQAGMICPGIVTNVTNFGAFVDIGVHQDGLVHISELAHKFVDDPRKVVNPGDQVKVKVMTVDKEKSKISLTMKLTEANPEAEVRAARDQARRTRRSEAGRAEQGRSDKNRSDNGRTPNNKMDSNRADSKRDDRRPNPRSMQSSPKGNQRPPPPPPRPAKPKFNNAFASLADLKNQFKK